LLLIRVTTPLVVTSLPANGLCAPVPWISYVFASNGVGPPPPPRQGCAGAALLRGSGARAAKSVLLLPASRQLLPTLARISVVVFEGAGAGAVSKQEAVAP
jgi:hypothetical protein